MHHNFKLIVFGERSVNFTHADKFKHPHILTKLFALFGHFDGHLFSIYAETVKIIMQSQELCNLLFNVFRRGDRLENGQGRAHENRCCAAVTFVDTSGYFHLCKLIRLWMPTYL